MGREKAANSTETRIFALKCRQGSILIGLIVVMVVLAVMAGAMVSFTTTSTLSQLSSSPGHQATLLADSGYRYSVLKYSAAADKASANQGLKDMHQKTYQLSPAEDEKSFNLDITSHWFQAPSGASSLGAPYFLSVSSMGSPPAGTLSGDRKGFIKVWPNPPYTRYSRYTNIDQPGSNLRFYLTGPIQQTTIAQNVYLVCLVNGAQNLSENSDLILKYDAATDNGIFLFPNSKAYIEIELAGGAVKTVSYDSVDYANRTLKGLRNIPDRPNQFPFTVGDGDRVTLMPFFTLKSTGAYREASAKVFFSEYFKSTDISKDMSGPPEAQYTFDDPSQLGKDEAGGHDATVHGGVTAAAGVIGGAAKLEAAAGGYLTVADSPGLEMSGVDRVSVAAWVKKSSPQTSENWVAVVQKSDYSYNLQFEDGNEPVFTIWDGIDRNDPAGLWKSAKAGFSVNTGEWYYIVGTFDAADPGVAQQVYSLIPDTPGVDRSLGHRRGIYTSGSLLDFSGEQIRVKFTATPAQQLTIDLAYIGERDGATWNIKSDPPKVQLTFNRGNDGVIIPAGQSVWSDWVNFPTRGTRDLIVSFDFGDIPSVPAFASGPSDRYWENTDGAANDTAPAGGTFYSYRAAVTAIEAGSGENVKIYVNGELRGTAFATQIGNATGWNIGIGANLDTMVNLGQPRYLDGLIDDVRIYNRALLPEEILDYYNWTKPN